MSLLGLVGVGVAVLFMLYILLTAFGSLHPGKFRTGLDKIAAFILKAFLGYLAAMIIFVVFSGLSTDRSFRSVLYNIFSVILGILVAGIFAIGALPHKEHKRSKN